MVQKCIMGGLSGGGTATELLSIPNLAASGTVTLSDDIDKYDFVEFVVAYYESFAFQGYCHFSSTILGKDVIDAAISTYGAAVAQGLFNIAGQNSFDYYMNWAFKINPSAKNQLIVGQKNIKGWSEGQSYIYKIVGYK